MRVPNVWIDQICIDQTAVLERNNQVSLMGQIYRGAYECFVYLGEGPEKPGDIKEVRLYVQRCRWHMSSVQDPFGHFKQQLKNGFLDDFVDGVKESCER